MEDQLLSTTPHHDTLPENYVRPESERPRLSEAVADSNIPVINLSSSDKSLIISQIANACENYGLFQVVNHGITEEMLRKVMGIGMEFYRLSPEEKAKLYSDDPAKKMRLSTSFNVKKEKVHNWRDYLRLHCYPLEDFVPDWPSKPELFKEIMSTYCTQVRQLGHRLFGYISESLSLEEDYIEKVLGKQEQHMAVNYYPQCPEPELTYGLPAHTDPNALTIILQDQQVTGLQVLKEGKWIAVDPVPWALIIYIGDQLQAVSNGRYRSVWPRAVVSSNKERMSIASFLSAGTGRDTDSPTSAPAAAVDIALDMGPLMSSLGDSLSNNINPTLGFEISLSEDPEQNTGSPRGGLGPNQTNWIRSSVALDAYNFVSEAMLGVTVNLPMHLTNLIMNRSNSIRQLALLAGVNLSSNTLVAVNYLYGEAQEAHERNWRAELIASVGAPIAVSVFTLLSSFRFASDPERWSNWIAELSRLNAAMIGAGPFAFYWMSNRGPEN